MTQAAKALSASLVVLGITLLSAALTFPSEVTTAERPFIEQAYTAQKQNDSEDAKVNEAVVLLIDTIFKERKVREAFERYFLFSNLSAEEQQVIDATSLHYSKEYAALDVRTVARIFSTGWNYEYQRVVLALGTKPLSDFDEAVEQAGSEVDNERKRILNQRGLSEADFYALLDWENAKDSKTLENNLTTLELINADIDRFIKQRTNQAILTKNLTEMKKNISVKKVSTEGCTLYAVSLKPMFGIMFMPRNGVLKMISFGDVL